MAYITASGYSGFDSALDAATARVSVILDHAAFVAAGTKSVLTSQTAAAGAREWVMVGNASASITTAQAQAICQGPTGTLVTSGQGQDPQRLTLSIGMTTYLTAIPAVAAGAYSIAFAVGGLIFSQVQSVEVVIKQASVTGSPGNRVISLPNVSSAVVLGGPAVDGGNNPVLTLNGSNALYEQNGTTAIAYGTNTVIAVPAYGVVFGAVETVSASDAPAAGDIIELILNLA
jgi:hypothetical protein